MKMNQNNYLEEIEGQTKNLLGPSGASVVRNDQRRVQARREELLPAIEKTAQHLFSQIEVINFEQGVFELVLPGEGDRLSIRVSQIEPKTCLVNILTTAQRRDWLQTRSRSHVRQFFRTLKLFLPKSKIY